MILLQVLNGVRQLWQARTMHRDIKLNNFLVKIGESVKPPDITTLDFKQTDVKVKVADFGFSKLLDANGQASTCLGSRETLAPETTTGESYDVKADIWSIGCMYYQLLTGFQSQISLVKQS